MQRRTFMAALPALAVAPAGQALSQPATLSAFPSKPVRLIVPKPAGGAFDALGRALATALSDAWKQPVVVENKPGAADMIAAAFVAKSAGDGYTLLLGASGITQNPSLYASMPYKPDELMALAKLVEIPWVFGVPVSLGVSNMSEFVAWTRKADPTKRNFATGATSAEVLGEIIKQKTGADLERVRYRGEQPAQLALLSGEVSAAILSPAAITAHAGKLRIIGVAGRKRLQGVDAHTLFEQGIPDTDLASWGGIFCPSTVPAALADMIARDVVAAGQRPDVMKRIAELGFVPAMSGHKEFTAFVGTEMDFWTRVVKQFDIKL